MHRKRCCEFLDLMQHLHFVCPSSQIAVMQNSLCLSCYVYGRYDNNNIVMQCRLLGLRLHHTLQKSAVAVWLLLVTLSLNSQCVQKESFHVWFSERNISSRNRRPCQTSYTLDCLQSESNTRKKLCEPTTRQFLTMRKNAPLSAKHC